jgi:hypothetical protein
VRKIITPTMFPSTMATADGRPTFDCEDSGVDAVSC